MAAVVPFMDLDGLHRDIRAQLDDAWHSVVDGSSFVGGQAVAKFEESWASYCEATEAVGVGNGTDSIELILRALGIGAGDEVIVPANTFIATAEAVSAVGARPVFVDVDSKSLLVTASHIEPALGPATAAIIAVHLYGQPCQMTDIMQLADAKGLAVIEDAAQAHGATWRGQRVGSLGTAASFSFYPSKNLGAFGDAGAVVTNDPSLAAKVRSIADHGRTVPGSGKELALLGRNSRLDGLQAAVLQVKLPYLDQWNENRRRAHAVLVHRLNHADVAFVSEHPEASGVHHLNIARVSERDDVRRRMIADGIDVRLHYAQPCHRHSAYLPQPSLPNVESAAASIMSLPIYPTIGAASIEAVAMSLESAIFSASAESAEVCA